MAKYVKPVPATFFLPGDKVLWKGILLTVTETFPDGSLEATSQTMRVRVSDPKEFVRYTPL